MSSRSSAPDRAGSFERAPSRLAGTAAWGLGGLAVLYPIALVFAWGLLRFAGERWWVTGATL